jgi:hypothetical protein
MRLILALLVVGLPLTAIAAEGDPPPAPSTHRLGVDLAGGARHIAASAGTRRTGWVGQLTVRPRIVGPLSLGMLAELDQRPDVSGPLRITQTRLGLAPILELASSGPVRAVGRFGLGWGGTWTAWAPGPGEVEGAAGSDVDADSLPATSLRSMPLLVLDAGVRFAPPGPLRITVLFSLEGRGAHVDLGGTLGIGLEL